jgi:hypothetical protein
MWKYIVYVLTCCKRKPEFPKTIAQQEEEEDEQRPLLHGDNSTNKSNDKTSGKKPKK